MADQVNVAELVARMPNADTAAKGAKGRSTLGLLTGPSFDEAQKIYDQVLAGGRQALADLIALLPPTDKPEHKARYLLHGMALYLKRTPQQQAQYAEFLQWIIALLPTCPNKAAQIALVELLEAFHARAAVPALGKLLNDVEVGDYACRAILSLRDGAAEQFRAALPAAAGTSRLNIIQALGVLRDKESLAVLKTAAADADLEVRLIAIWGLANMPDAGSVDLLIKATGAQGWERTHAIKACILMADNLASGGDKASAARIHTHLSRNCTDPSEKHFKQLAEESLADRS